MAIGKDLVPHKDTNRLAQSGRPERVVLDQSFNLGRISHLDKPEPAGALTIRRLQRPGGLHLGCVSFQKCQMFRHMSASNICADRRVILKEYYKLHGDLTV